ncbi:hypothetical protein J6590_107439 [Homalodisca vitripennis]|nr:hypothetical protein J6590_107439 [Homalodisca vitripennis]
MLETSVEHEELPPMMRDGTPRHLAPGTHPGHLEPVTHLTPPLFTLYCLTSVSDSTFSTRSRPRPLRTLEASFLNPSPIDLVHCGGGALVQTAVYINILSNQQSYIERIWREMLKYTDWLDRSAKDATLIGMVC